MADNSKYDGSVVISVEVDAKGFDKGAGDIEKAMKSFENTMKKSIEDMSKVINTNLSEALNTLGTTAHKAKQTASKTAKSSAKSTGELTKEYQELAAFVAQQEKNLAKLEEYQNKYPEKMQNILPAFTKFTEKDNPLDSSGGYANIREQIEHYKTELEQARTAMQALEESGKMYSQSLSQELANVSNSVSQIDFTPLDISKYEPSVQKYVIAVNKANFAYAQQASQLRQLEAQLALLRSKEQTPETEQKTNEIINKIEAIKVKLQELKYKANEAQNALNNALDSEGGGQSQGLQPFKSVGTIAKKVVSTLGELAKSFANVGKKAGKTASKLNIFNGAQKRISSAAKSLLKPFTSIFRMLKGRVRRLLVTTIFTSITDGLKEMSKVDKQFNESVSTLQSSFKQFASAIVSTFAPLIKVVAPILSKITQYITAVADKAAQLIAALTGQSTYQKANYNYKDYAESLDDTTESTDDLADSTEKLNKQLAAFDELNVLSTTSDSDISSTLLDDNALDTDPVYTEVPIDFNISNLSERIKEAFAVGDFTDLGIELGEKINEGIAKIDSTKIGSTIANIINSASSFAIGFLSTVRWDKLTSKIVSNINTLIDEIDTELLGQAFAEIINTIFEIGFTFATEFGWEEFGTKVADFINSVFENTDRTKVGQTINSFAIGFLDMILSFLDNLDGNEIGEGIGEVVKEIDFIGIATRLAKIVWKTLKLTWNILTGLWEGSGILGWWEEQGAKAGRKFAEKFKKWGFDKLFKDYKQMFNDIIKFFYHVFSGQWDEAWKDFNNIVVDKLNTMIGKVEVMLKSLLGDALPSMLESLTSIIVTTLNSIIGPLGQITGELLGWVLQPIADNFSSDLRNVDFSLPRIPRFATGTVVPANYGEFAAILGDNKRETEVVSPLSTMKQAMIEALADVGLTGGNNSGDIVINIDSREIFRVTKKEADKYKRMHGKPAFG